MEKEDIKEEFKGNNPYKEDINILKREEVKNILETSDIKGIRVCEKLDDMLNALNDDLYAYYYWEDEEGSNSEKLSNLYNKDSAQIPREGLVA